MNTRALLSTFLFLGFAAHGQVVRKPHVEVELVSAVGAVQKGQSLLIALRLKMEKGWHVYWRNPGDSGEPTRLDWDLPKGLEAGPLIWPAPKRISVPPLVNFGYEGEVFLLTEILPGAPEGKSVRLSGQAHWLVCKEECIPGQATLSLELPLTPSKPDATAWAQRLEAVRAATPTSSPKWSAETQVAGENLILTLRGPTTGFAGADFFPYSETLIQHAATPRISVGKDTITFEIPRSPYAENAVPTPEDWKGVVVFAESGTAIEVLPAPIVPGWGGFWEALLLAFLGGIILNLMPCVFPVLCLKVLSFTQLGGKQRRKVAHHSVAYTIGILVSFWALAGTLIALRTGGQFLGWGFQLQSPYFVAALSFLLVGLALNLFGVFEIGGAMMGVGQKWAGRESTAGAFFSGVLATVVATPCTAPFMGTAMGYALSQPAAVAMSVFTSLGLGLAFPYILFSIFPALTTRLPHPGMWMVIFKQFMAFPLLLTAWWLLSVLALQSDTYTVFQLILALIGFSMGLWIGGLQTKRRGLRIVLALAVIAVSLAWACTELRRAPAPGVTKAAATEGWEAYTESALTSARQSGRPVFIDFTAAWCISCQVNERVALSIDTVKKRFKEKDVILFKADWTNQDEAIARKLESYGRNGVPLYVLYPPGEKSEPRILPQILTPDIVISALNALETTP